MGLKTFQAVIKFSFDASYEGKIIHSRRILIAANDEEEAIDIANDNLINYEKITLVEEFELADYSKKRKGIILF